MLRKDLEAFNISKTHISQDSTGLPEEQELVGNIPANIPA